MKLIWNVKIQNEKKNYLFIIHYKYQFLFIKKQQLILYNILYFHRNGMLMKMFLQRILIQNKNNKFYYAYLCRLIMSQILLLNTTLQKAYYNK